MIKGRWILLRNLQIGLIVLLCALLLTSCSPKTEQVEIGNETVSEGGIALTIVK